MGDDQKPVRAREHGECDAHAGGKGDADGRDATCNAGGVTAGSGRAAACSAAVTDGRAGGADGRNETDNRNTPKTASKQSGKSAPNQRDDAKRSAAGSIARKLEAGRALARETLGLTEVLTGLALGCMLAWIPMTFQSLNIVGDAGENVLDLVYLISIISLIATLMFVAATHSKTARWITRGPVRASAAVLMAASTALLPLTVAATGADPGASAVAGSAASAMFVTPAAFALAAAAGIVSGAASGIFLMQFGILISKYTAKAAAAIAAIGYLLMSALFCLFSFFGTLESCVFAASMPLLSAAMRDLGAHTEKSKAAISAKSLPAQTMPANPDELRKLKHLTVALALCAALVGCANELSRTLYIQMGIAGVGNGNYALIQTGAALIIGLGATLLTLALVSMKTPRAPEICYRILMLFLALGAMLLPVPILYPQIGAVVPYAINAAAFQCFGILAWVLICGVCHRYLGTCVRTFAITRAGWAAGPLVGMLIGRFIVRGTDFGPAEVYPCAIFGTLLMMACSSMAFTERDLAFAVDLLPTEKRRRFTDKCQSVAKRCGLSDRETEIMTLFAKGRNLAYIQEQLCLSKSTVSTHRQHIYQKLNVHSSQEMIDLIQEEKA
jgi:DNA-binding CsgD family transcriptional regulator